MRIATQKRKDRLLAQGFCTKCGKNSIARERSINYCASCLDRLLVQQQGYYRKDSARIIERKKVYWKEYSWGLRLQVFAGYGGCCNCCGEIEPLFLSLDHVTGDGGDHRAQRGNGVLVLLDVIKEGFPDRYQVLCYNCHMAKDFHGGCPHLVAA
jgi:hypothetical protein